MTIRAAGWTARALAGIAAPSGHDGGDDHVGDAGFTLFDVLLGLMLMALIAALVLPGPQRPNGPAALRATAYQVSALLRDARTAAIGFGRPAGARVDPTASRVASTASGVYVDMPSGVSVALLNRANQTIGFAPDGTSTGGNILLQGPAARMTIAVSADTGAIRLATP